MSPYDARGRDLVWLLTIHVAGRVVRVSDVGAVIEEAAIGAEHGYPGALLSVSTPSVDLVDGGDLPSGSASVEWLHPTEGGWPEIVEADPDLQDATAELALWATGTDYRRRHIVVAGRLAVTGYGAPAEPVSASISLRLQDDRGLVPSPALTASSTRWPRVAGTVILPDSSRDVPYPLIFGSPGYPGTDLDTHRGWPVLLVEIDDSDRSNVTNAAIVLIHGTVAQAATVTLYNETTGLSASVSVTSTRDRANTWVAIASVAGGTLAISEGDELWASAPSASAAGLPQIGSRSGGLRQAGDVVRWLLMQSTLTVDFGAMEGDIEALNRYALSGVLNEGRAPAEVVGELLELLPCGWYVAPRGLALRVWPDETEPEAATIGPLTGCDRVSQVEPSDPEEVYDAYRIEYDYDRADSAARRSIALVPQPDPSDSAQIRNIYAVNSNNRGGQPPTLNLLRWADTIDADMVTDAGTAFALVSAQARRYSRLRYTVTYDCPPEMQFIGVGRVVRWTDPEVRADSRCRIVAIGYGTSSCSLTLETL